MSIEVVLVGLVALALIVMVLAGMFSLGERRLGETGTAMPPFHAQPHVLHGSPGLRAPAPLPEAQVRPVDPIPTAIAPESPPEPAPDLPAAAAGASDTPAPAVAAAPLPEAPSANLRPRISLGEYLGFTQFTKIRDAYLNRPDPIVNPDKLQRPQPTESFAQARTQSHLTPEGLRELIAERQAMQSLHSLRSQARINPNRLTAPATQPAAR